MALTTEHRSGRPYRVGDLLGMTVVGRHGDPVGEVAYVRVRWDTDATGTSTFLVDGVVVGSPRAGSLLGDDRRRQQGPTLVRAAARWLHRHSSLVPWDDVTRIDWPGRVGSVRLHVEAGRPTTEDHTGW
ncbi:hypothetical protein BN12_4160003 [Nostocoides japonicum T1-X7]|uniref:PRC-barrel domain-containing protein n=1 Tax=Nostocoides japonicum T1-X7 TaxID=1194083 RepID=A0A077M0E9_9MICO|nr:hypothetical protein [Tetrasphaera japonica]CCH79326.1 hypothetical protein BN12_4160003 [Tetrasphaera japonica T1-X7]